MTEKFVIPPEVRKALETLPKQQRRKIIATIFNSPETTVLIGSDGKFLGTVGQGASPVENSNLITVFGLAGSSPSRQAYQLAASQIAAAVGHRPGRRRPRLSSVFSHSQALQAFLPRQVRADREFEQQREQSLRPAQPGAPRVVLDTNVVAGGLIEVVAGAPESAGRILQMVIEDGSIVPVALPHLIRELEGLWPKLNRQNPHQWTRTHRELLKEYRARVFPVGFADLSINFSDQRVKRAIAGLVPDDPSDVQVLASSLTTLGGPLEVVTYDRHMLGNVGPIRKELGVEVTTPAGWLLLFAPALLAAVSPSVVK